MFLFDKLKNPDRFTLVPGKLTSTKDALDSGVYNLNFVSTGPMSPPQIIFEKTTKYSTGMHIDGGVFSEAREKTNKFVLPEMYEARKVMGMMDKIGFIFDGKPGTGKTYLAGQIADKFAKEFNAIGIISTSHDTNYPQLIDHIREFDKDRLIVLVMDEFEKSRAKYTSEMLSFLDGTDSRENVITIATINEISELPSYLKNRPGRFEHILKFKSDDKTVLKSIITQCIPGEYKDEFDVDVLVKEFTNKNNASKFGLNNERDDFTVDRLRVVIRDLVAMKIKEKEQNQVLEAPDKVAYCKPNLEEQVELATEAVEQITETDKLAEERPTVKECLDKALGELAEEGKLDVEFIEVDQ